TALASGNKFCERDTLFCCQGYFVYLLHGHVRVRGKMFEGKNELDKLSKKQTTEKYIKLRMGW
ncbi:MAG: hypothetical protein FWE67_03970, partial [Planctomycetaceae bacterium]|nr:hypothetical protein [Planctomycetaceae bacterium]